MTVKQLRQKLQDERIQDLEVISVDTEWGDMEIENVEVTSIWDDREKKYVPAVRLIPGDSK